ncbi:MAG: 4-hydroxythreonine-4-phosphate dehydrogenase PdxA [Pseudomonadota bacterium]
MSTGLLPLALTMGDPSGIGGEIALKAWASGAVAAPFFLIDDPDRLSDMIPGVPVRPIAAPSEAHASWPLGVPVLPHPLAAPSPPGRPDPANAKAVIAAIERAVALAHAGDAAGVVTNPINKHALYEGAGFAFPGHTEFLAALGGVSRTVMMIAGPTIRTVPITIHEPLAAVPALLDQALIVETGRITAAALSTDFGIAEPRLAFTGLNPHAGEGGAMGREEIEVIVPALETLRAEGIAATGPHPADTLFHAGARRRYDVALAMYHDQALIPAKALDFDRGVNVTLGLPFIRTSPDHGTAYDIAGTGQADPTSLIEALNLAATLAARRRAAVAAEA